jgi:hypothetical protein
MQLTPRCCGEMYNEGVVPYPDISRWVSAARASCGKTAALRSRFLEDFGYLFTFYSVSNTGILIIFT